MLGITVEDLIVRGFGCSALGSPHTYPSKITDQLNMQQAALTGGKLWCGTLNNEWSLVYHTPAEALEVLQAFVVYKDTLR